MTEYCYVLFCHGTRGATADRKYTCRLCAVKGHISEQRTSCLDIGFRHMFSSPWSHFSGGASPVQVTLFRTAMFGILTRMF